MPYVSYGELKKATEVAKHNLSVLESYVSSGYTVTSTEPTAVYMLREVYPKLVPEAHSSKTAEASSGFFKLLQNEPSRL